MFSWLVFAHTVAYAAPDRVALTVEAGTSITDVVVSTDGATVAMLDGGAGIVQVLDFMF